MLLFFHLLASTDETTSYTENNLHHLIHTINLSALVYCELAG